MAVYCFICSQTRKERIGVWQTDWQDDYHNLLANVWTRLQPDQSDFLQKASYSKNHTPSVDVQIILLTIHVIVYHRLWQGYTFEWV